VSKLQSGYDHSPPDIDYESSRETKMLSIYPGKEVIVSVLDTAPVRVMRHKLYIKGDRGAKHKRATCWGWNPDEHPQLPKGVASCPRECISCNAMLVSPAKDFIGRGLCYYLSVINESDVTDQNGRQLFDKQGRPYKDTKRLLELDWKGYQSFQQKAKTYGQLAGMRFRVNRSGPPPGQKNIQSPTYGDIWEPLDVKPVDLVRHFWQSPVIARVQEGNARKSSTVIPHEQAVRELVKPFNYDEEVGEYSAEEHGRFVAYAEGMFGRFQGSQTQPGGYAPPPPPPGAMPNYASAPPASAMPSGQVPSYSQGPPQPPAAPQYAPPTQAPMPAPSPFVGAPAGPTPPWQQPGPQGAPPQPQYAPPFSPPGGAPPQGFPFPQGGYPGGPPQQQQYAPPQGYGAPPGYPAQQVPGQPPMMGTPRLPAAPDPAGARQASYAAPPSMGAPQGGFSMPTGPMPGMPQPAQRPQGDYGAQGWSSAPPGAADDDPI
jgi:hypothetical protein